MALYKFERFLRQSGDAAFEKTLPAGTPAPRSGIYRCDGCGHEITVMETTALPGADHHPHTSSQKLVRWKLIVADSGAPSTAAAPAFRSA